MYISLFWLVLVLICYTCSDHGPVSECVRNSDCNTHANAKICCNGRCRHMVENGCRCQCRCQTSDDCNSYEICKSYRCQHHTPTKAPTIRRYNGGCRGGSDSDCREGEVCFRSSCRSRESLSNEDDDQDKYGSLLESLLPVLIALVVLPPCIAYCAIKLGNMELERRRRRRYGRPYRPPVARAPQNGRAGDTTESPASLASERQSVNTSSHNDRTVIQLERLAPSAPELSPSGEVATSFPGSLYPGNEVGEVVEDTTERISQGPHEQTGIDVSSATAIGYPFSLPPSASSPFNEERRAQNGEGDSEQPPPSYEEAIKNYNVVARL